MISPSHHGLFMIVVLFPRCPTHLAAIDAFMLHKKFSRDVNQGSPELPAHSMKYDQLQTVCLSSISTVLPTKDDKQTRGPTNSVNHHQSPQH
jgi:hypothetical protein